jgi:hypothetical protein
MRPRTGRRRGRPRVPASTEAAIIRHRNAGSPWAVVAEIAHVPVKTAQKVYYRAVPLVARPPQHHLRSVGTCDVRPPVPKTRAPKFVEVGGERWSVENLPAPILTAALAREVDA